MTVKESTWSKRQIDPSPLGSFPIEMNAMEHVLRQGSVCRCFHSGRGLRLCYRNSRANVVVGFIFLTEVVTINGLEERIDLPN